MEAYSITLWYFKISSQWGFTQDILIIIAVCGKTRWDEREKTEANG
jgi:hypothetical protein